MQNFIPEEKYKMVAVIGTDVRLIEQICKKHEDIGEFVTPANYNYSGQTVISGEAKAVEKVIEELKENGVKKIIQLKTTGPFHTKKLIKAKELFEEELKKVQFNNSNIKVIKNIDGTEYKQNDNLVNILANHIISPVRFDKIIELMKREEVDTYIEVGPGKALSGFIKKENPDATTLNIYDLESLENVIKTLNN